MRVENKMKKTIIIGIFAITVLFSFIIVWGIIYLNEPPQGAPYSSVDIISLNTDYFKDADNNYFIQVYGNLCYDIMLYSNHFNPLPIKVIIYAQTNESLEIQREIVSSKNFTLQMEFNETTPFNEKLSVSEGTYIVKIAVFALKPNKWWGTTWAQTDGKYSDPITLS